MSDLDLFVEVTNAIESGRLDKRLNQVYSVLQRRINLTGIVFTVDDFSVGSLVMFNDRCAKAELRGVKATVTGIEEDKVIVQLIDPKEGYYKELSDGYIMRNNVRVAPDLLVRVE